MLCNNPKLINNMEDKQQPNPPVCAQGHTILFAGILLRYELLLGSLTRANLLLLLETTNLSTFVVKNSSRTQLTRSWSHGERQDSKACGYSCRGEDRHHYRIGRKASETSKRYFSFSIYRSGGSNHWLKNADHHLCDRWIQSLQIFIIV